MNSEKTRKLSKFLATFLNFDEEKRTFSVLADNVGCDITYFENKNAFYEHTLRPNHLKIRCKQDKFEVLPNPTFEFNYYQDIKDRKLRKAFYYCNVFYDWETHEEIDVEESKSKFKDGMFYTKLPGDKTLEEEIENHKKYMIDVRNILQKHNIDPSIVDKAYEEPKNVMMAIISKIFEPFQELEFECDNNEDQIVTDASRGPLYYHETGEFKDPYYLYDLNGCYLDLFKRMILPTGGAEETKTFNEGDIGIYKCKCEELPYYYGKDIEYYTNYDLLIFDKLKIKYVIVKGVRYTKYIDCSSLKKMKVFDDLYENKNVAFNEMKKFWGCLSQLNTRTVSGDEIREGDKIISYCRSNNKYVIMYGSHEHKYKTRLFRIKAFINSFSRYNTYMKVMKLENHGHNIIRIHNDSILTDCKPDIFGKYFCISKKLGDFKHETKYDFSNGVKIESFTKFYGLKK